MMNSENLINTFKSIVEDNFDKLTDEERKGSRKVRSVSTQGEIKEEEVALEKSEIISRIVYLFITNFEISLPAPNSVTLEAQLKALETYEQALDKALDAWISDKFITEDTTGEIAKEVSLAKEIIRGYYLRKYMTENGIMPELAQLTTTKEDGEPVIDVYHAQQTHMEALAKSLTKLFTNLSPFKEENNKEVEKLNLGGSSFSSSDDSTSSSTGSDDFGSDSFSMPDESTPADNDNESNNGLDNIDLPSSDDLSGNTTDESKDKSNSESSTAKPDEDEEKNKDKDSSES